MASAKRKLFGHVAIPEGATHCCIHQTKANSAMGPKLKLQGDKEQWFDAFPLGEVTRAWVVANFGPGVYRLSWIAIDSTGARKSIPPSTGAIDIQDPTPVPANTPPGAPAAPAQLPISPDMLAALTAANGQIGPMQLVQLVLQIQASSEQKAMQFYALQSERDRAFTTQLLTIHGMRAEGEDDPDPDDDPEEGDMAERIAGKIGEQLGPLVSMAKSYMEKGT